MSEQPLLRAAAVERIVLTAELDVYMSLRALSTYSGLGVRTLRRALSDPANPLPHYRLGAAVRVRCSDFDKWATAYRRVGTADVEGVVRDVLSGLHP